MFFNVVNANILRYVTELYIIPSGVLIDFRYIFLQIVEFIINILIFFGKFTHPFLKILLLIMNPVSRLLNSPTSFSRIDNLSIYMIDSFAEEFKADIFGSKHVIYSPNDSLNCIIMIVMK